MGNGTGTTLETNGLLQVSAVGGTTTGIDVPEPGTSVSSDRGAARASVLHSLIIRRLGDQTGMVSVEAAIALSALAAVVVMALVGINAVIAQVRCTDAAREVARMVARGQSDQVRTAMDRIAPSGAAVTVDVSGDEITVRVDCDVTGGLLPAPRVAATAFAFAEPDGVT